MAEKFYVLTKELYDGINAKLPSETLFGFSSHGKYYVTGSQIIDLTVKHGELLNLSMQAISGQTLEAFKTANESSEYEAYKTQKNKNQDGFDAYEKMFGIINTNGGLGASIDNDMLPAYAKLTILRMLLKDGAFEMALRHWVNEIAPLNLISEVIASECVAIIEDLCVAYGTDKDIISLIKSTPKGSL